MKNTDDKKYDVDKEISRCAVYRPLCFKEKGRIIKWDYNRETYCEILKEEARYMYSAESKADFVYSFAQAVLGLLDKEDDNIDSYTDKELDKEKEKLRKNFRPYCAGQDSAVFQQVIW